mmetsp:Transcript_33188/g.43729  ORF Transcript_33188/g.43729 Transcript_33188/m.43729 type:complete len:820 (+) Transcript_33188:229-2688(+)
MNARQLNKLAINSLFLAFYLKNTLSSEVPYNTADGSVEANEYGQSLSVRTLGFGIGCAAIVGLFNFIVCVGCCCRLPCCCRCCKKNAKIGSSGGENNGEEVKQDEEIQVAKGLRSGEVEVPYSRMRYRLFYALYGVVFVGMLLCGALAANFCQDTQGVVDDSFEATKTLMLESAEFLCSDDEEALKDSDYEGNVCEDDTLGDFLQDAEAYAFGIFDQAIVALSGVAQITNITDSILAGAAMAPGLVSGMKSAMVNINTTIYLIHDEINYLSDDSNTGGVDISGDLPDFSTLPTVTNDDMQVFDDAKEDMESMVKDVNSTSQSLNDMLGTVNEYIFLMDGVEGNEANGTVDYKVKMQESLDPFYDSLINTSLSILEIEEKTDEVHLDVQEYYDSYTAGIALFAWLPAIVVLLTCCCTFGCKSRKPLALSMVFLFLFHGLYCMVFGFLLTFQAINSDLCDWHVVILEDVVPSVLNFTYADKIYDVLSCPEAVDGVITEDNNLIDILDARQLLNISTSTGGLKKEFTQNVYSVMASLSRANSSVTAASNVDVETSITFNSTEVTAPLMSIKRDLPPSPFERNNPEHQAQFMSYYGTGDLSAFSFSDYWNYIQDVNVILAAMSIIPTGPDSYDNATIQNLTTSFINTSEWTSASYTPYTYSDLYTAVYITQVQTEVLSTVVDANDLTHSTITKVFGYVGVIEMDLLEIEAMTQGLIGLGAGIADGFAQLSSYIKYMIFVQLMGAFDQMNSIQDFLFGANQYTQCGFIGNFYRDFYLDTWCIDLNQNLYDIGMSFVVLVFLMAGGHLLIGFFYPTIYDRRFSKL